MNTENNATRAMNLENQIVSQLEVIAILKEQLNANATELEEKEHTIKRLSLSLMEKHLRLDRQLDKIAKQRTVIEALQRRLAGMRDAAQTEQAMRLQSDDAANTLARAMETEDGQYAVRIASALGGNPTA